MYLQTMCIASTVQIAFIRLFFKKSPCVPPKYTPPIHCPFFFKIAKSPPVSSSVSGMQ